MEWGAELSQVLLVGISPARVCHRDSVMGGDMYPPIGGGQQGGDKAYMGGDLRVNFATF